MTAGSLRAGPRVQSGRVVQRVRQSHPLKGVAVVVVVVGQDFTFHCLAAGARYQP